MEKKYYFKCKIIVKLNLIYIFSALKIHVSSDTKAALDYFGNFILIPRGEIDVKVSV